MLTVKHRETPKLAVIVAYNERSGRKGKVLVSEPIGDRISNEGLLAAAQRLVPQVPDYDVILPIGVDL